MTNWNVTWDRLMSKSEWFLTDRVVLSPPGVSSFLCTFPLAI